MFCRLKRSRTVLHGAPERPPIPRSSAVPRLDDWAAWGAVGLVGHGSHAGQYVLADPFRTDTGTIIGWVLDTPGGEALLRSDGASVFDDDTWDEPRGRGGSFIDEATDALAIQWAVDPMLVERVVRERFAWILLSDE